MPKFKVTIQQHTLEEKTVIIEAGTYGAACRAAYDSGEYLSGDDFKFVSIPDRWIGDVKEIKEI